MIMKKKVENWPAPCQALFWSRRLSSWNFHSCGAGNKQIGSCTFQIVRNSVKKKRAGIELESLGLSVCVYGFFFFRWGEVFWWLRQGDTWEPSGKKGQERPRKRQQHEGTGNSKEARWGEVDEWGKDGGRWGWRWDGTRSHRPYTQC